MAALDIVTLDTATPQLEVPQAADTYNAPRAFAIAPVSLTGSAATTSFDVTQTWNTTGTPSAIKLNVTDTASNAASLLMDLQVGGASALKISKFGSLCGSAGNNFGTVYINGTSTSDANVAIGGPLAEGVTVRSAGFFAFSSTTSPAHANRDVILARDDVGVLAQRRTTVGGTTYPQAFRIYNTYTDASNYERFELAWVSNAIELGATKAGSGSGRDARFIVGTNALAISSASASNNIAYISSTNFGLAANVRFSWTSGTNAGAVPDSGIRRAAAGVMQVDNGQSSAGGGALQLIEMTAPAAPAANGVRIYAEDDGAGATQMALLFSGSETIKFRSTGFVSLGGTTSSFPALKRSSTSLIVRLADDTANAPLESASVKTDAPAGGTSGTWKLGVAATVSPTLPNRTIEVDIGGTIYYIAAKTTND